jgi:penicillin-binding protein 1A
MASGQRREPTFGSDSDLHVDPADRPPREPRPRKPRKPKSRKKPRRSIRTIVGRLAYWCFVLALWFGIAGVGAVVWVGAHLPPIQSLEIPPRAAAR